MDWKVTVYDEGENIIAEWTIEDRTEQSAQKEAEAEVARTPNANDWTMTQIGGDLF
jgi:hypothetical protein